MIDNKKMLEVTGTLEDFLSEILIEFYALREKIADLDYEIEELQKDNTRIWQKVDPALFGLDKTDER